MLLELPAAIYLRSGRRRRQAPDRIRLRFDDDNGCRGDLEG
jgi:hypothetical protein